MNDSIVEQAQVRGKVARRCLTAALVVTASFGLVANAVAQSVLVANANNN